jgi:hypothetical protein
METEPKFSPEQKKPDIESEIMSSIEGQIINLERFKEFMSENGFTSGRRGTFESEEKGAFLYIKRCFLVKTKQDAENSLSVLKHLTEKGMLYPSTK